MNLLLRINRILLLFREIEKREVEAAKKVSAEEKPSNVAPAPVPAATSAPALPSGVTEAAIQELMALGYKRPAVIAALEASGGNVDLAASILLGN